MAAAFGLTLLVPIAFHARLPVIHEATVSTWSDKDRPVDPTSLPERGRVYVPAYSSIAAGGGTTKIHLTVTLSIRNLSDNVSLVISRIDYYDTKGVLVRSYLDEPRTLDPLGTAEVIIADRDVHGGTGAKFLVDWSAPTGAPPPLVEAVMIGLYGAQGFSFVSPGRALP